MSIGHFSSLQSRHRVHQRPAFIATAVPAGLNRLRETVLRVLAQVVGRSRVLRIDAAHALKLFA